MAQSLWLCLLALLCSPLIDAATITGTVELGDPPRERRRHDRYAHATEEAGPPPPRTAIVYLEGEFPLGEPPPPVDLLQEDLQFRPSLLAVPVGGSVRFPNRDETYHNVFSYSPAKNFDLGRYRPEETAPVVDFPVAGVVEVFCEVHEHMRATILVLETPHFTSTDAEGKFALADLPAGEYTLVAWISPRQVYRQPVKLEPDSALELTLAPE